MHNIYIQFATDKKLAPSAAKLRRWAKLALTEIQEPASLTLRLVTPDEIHSANHQFRQKDKPTNVISFPNDEPIEEENYIGDIMLCPEILNEEAIAQNKTQDAHWAHLVIHSVLHLLGHDHHTDHEAVKMETIEIRLLKTLGFTNPYFI